ncbi:hypothetical protein ACLOJK_027214 [Asimina triloba]
MPSSIASIKDSAAVFFVLELDCVLFADLLDDRVWIDLNASCGVSLKHGAYCINLLRLIAYGHENLLLAVEGADTGDSGGPLIEHCPDELKKASCCDLDFCCDRWREEDAVRSGCPPAAASGDGGEALPLGKTMLGCRLEWLLIDLIWVCCRSSWKEDWVAAANVFPGRLIHCRSSRVGKDGRTLPYVMWFRDFCLLLIAAVDGTED